MCGATEEWGREALRPWSRGDPSMLTRLSREHMRGVPRDEGAPRTEGMALILIGLHDCKFGAPPIIGGREFQGAPRGHQLPGIHCKNQGGAGAPRGSSVWCPPNYRAQFYTFSVRPAVEEGGRLSK